MAGMPQYQNQVSPELPAGPSPGQIIAGFHPPDTRVGQAVTDVVTSTLTRIAELNEKSHAADKTAELARARAEYFKRMKEWTLNLQQSDLDPQEYRSEFETESNAVATELSKGFRHSDTLDAFTTWKTEQDAAFITDVHQTQLAAMQDRFTAAMMQDLEILKVNPDYLPTYLANVKQGLENGTIQEAPAQALLQSGIDITEVSRAKSAIRGMGLLEAREWLNNPYNAPGLDDTEKDTLFTELERDDKVRTEELKKKDDELDRVFADLFARADSVKLIYDALNKLTTAQYNDGDRKYTWIQRFRSLLGTPDDNPLKKDPDPETLKAMLDIERALQYPGMRLPNDPKYGELAGKEVTNESADRWGSQRLELLGNQYKPFRDRLSDAVAKTEAYRVMSDLCDEQYKKGKITAQQLGEFKARSLSYCRTYNPDLKEAAGMAVGYFMGQPKQVTQDQGTTGSGAELGVRIWNNQFPDWTWMDDPNIAKQIEGKAIVQTTQIEKYLGKPPDTLSSLPKETLDQMGLSKMSPVDLAKNYLVTENGAALFHANGKWLAYVPEKYDPAKPSGQKYSGGKETLMEYSPGDPDPGKRWKPYVAVPELKTPSAGTKYQGGLSAQQMGKIDANDIKNQINDLKVKRQKEQYKIDVIKKDIEKYYPENKRWLPAYKRLVREMGFAEEAVKTYDLNISNLEDALKQRQGSK